MSAPARQPWGYVGTFADLHGYLWMVTLKRAVVKSIKKSRC
jgi:hypothetical protein